MGRALRVVEPGGVYHVISRGNNKGRLYWDDLDRETFLMRLERAAEKYEWIGLGYCLMTNHYHLVVKVPSDGLSAGMQELNGNHARRANSRHGRIGHLFQNRFYARHLETELDLLGVLRYIVLNPVRAGLCSHSRDWRWSSYRACAAGTVASKRTFLSVAEVLGLLGTGREAARVAYCDLIESGHVQVSDDFPA